MKLIKPKFEILEQLPLEVGMFKHIETCGRVAWKSEERITDNSYIKFIDMLKGVNHGSVLEHGTVYLHIPNQKYEFLTKKYVNNKYSKLINNGGHNADCYITTNYRVLVENNWLDDLKYQCKPTEFHEKRVTVKFICDRGVSHEFVRHRTFSFIQESTRYCNYSKDKFGNELTFIIPCWLESYPEEIYCGGVLDLHKKLPEDVKCLSDKNSDRSCIDMGFKWGLTMLQLQNIYKDLISFGEWKPQQARSVLPNSLKTELIMTGLVSDWKHFFMLRTATGAHPQASELAIPLEEEFKRLNLI